MGTERSTQSTALADAQTNSKAPQFAFFRTQSNNPDSGFGLMLHAGDGGSLAVVVSPASGKTRYAAGTVLHVTATPEAGHVLKTLLVDGKEFAGKILKKEEAHIKARPEWARHRG